MDRSGKVRNSLSVFSYVGIVSLLTILISCSSPPFGEDEETDPVAASVSHWLEKKKEDEQSVWYPSFRSDPNNPQSAYHPLNASSDPTEGLILPEPFDLMRAYRANVLVVGMTKADVLEIWGQPTEIETAGKPSYGNQKWIYYSGLHSVWNRDDARIVYFEGGRVVGWKR